MTEPLLISLLLLQCALAGISVIRFNRMKGRRKIDHFVLYGWIATLILTIGILLYLLLK